MHAGRVRHPHRHLPPAASQKEEEPLRGGDAARVLVRKLLPALLSRAAAVSLARGGVGELRSGDEEALPGAAVRGDPGQQALAGAGAAQGNSRAGAFPKLKLVL